MMVFIPWVTINQKQIFPNSISDAYYSSICFISSINDPNPLYSDKLIIGLPFFLGGVFHMKMIIWCVSLLVFNIK